MISDVSIAMATFNGERFIGEQLESLAAQTMLPRELVVSDDGSSDRTLEIVDAFARRAPFPVRVHRNAVRLGHRDNFITAALLCSGVLIAFCDQDDVWRKRKIERCAAAFRDSEVMLCIHAATVWYGGEDFRFQLPDIRVRKCHGKLTADPLRIYPGFAMVFRRELLGITDNLKRPPNIGRPLEEGALMAHDQWVWFLAAIFGRIVMLPASLSLYRQHDANLYGATAPKGGLGGLSDWLRRLKFDGKVRHFAEYAGFLERLGEALPVQLQPAAGIAARRFRERAALRILRQRIYAGDASARERWLAFADIFRRKGYFVDGGGARLGPVAAMKDLSLGVARLHGLI